MAQLPREELISVGGIKAHTLIGGRGAPLLVLHGAGGPNGWRRWHAALAEQFTLYVPAHPGYGLSDSANWMESVRDLARYYLWFLDELGLERISVIGHSLGGWLLAEMAVMNPKAFDKLVLVAPADFLPRVTNETLIVWGRQDRIVPLVCGEQYQRHLPNATLRIIDGCGHSPNIERPDEYVHILTEFLSPATSPAASEARP